MATNEFISKKDIKVDDYKKVFGTDGSRTKWQQHVWDDLVMKLLLESTTVEKQQPRTARDLAIHIFKTVEKS